MKTGLIRIASNYARLLLTLTLGLVVVPLTISWLGDEAFGIIALLGASVGLAALFRDLTHRSMIRELGASFHAGDEEHFLRTYNSAYLLSLGVVGLTVLSFAVLLALFPLLNISEPLRRPSMWFLVAQASHAVLVVFLSPAFNMYLVQHRFVSYNAWTVMLRGANLFAVVILAYIFGRPGTPAELATYGVVWAALDNLFLLTAVAIIMARDRRLLIRPRYASRAALRPILGTFGWNTGVQFSMASIERLPPFILNVMIGPVANVIWGVVYRLVSYVRMATIGVQFGADAVSAKMSAAGDKAALDRVQKFMTAQTRLNSLVALPVGLAMFALAEPVLQAWVGSRLQNPAAVLGPATVMTRILAVAVVTRAVSEGWVTVLYGAGFVSRYAPVVFVGGVLSPVLGVVAVLLLPDGLKVQGPALAFMLVVSTVYLLALPVVGAKCVEQRYLHMLAPMLRPLCVAAVAAPALWIGRLLGPGPVNQIVIPGLAFGALYAPLALALVLTPAERARALSLARGGRRPRAADRSAAGDSHAAAAEK